MLLAYLGPEQMLPVGSALAAIVGGLLFGWRWVAAWCARAWRAVRGMRRQD